MLDVIDLSGLQDKELRSVERIAKEIGRACRDIGFFYVRNHGIPPELMAGAFAVSKEFFARPSQARANFRLPNPGITGVMPASRRNGSTANMLT